MLPTTFESGLEDLIADDSLPVAEVVTESAVSIEPAATPPATPATPATPVVKAAASPVGETTPAEAPTTTDAPAVTDTVDWDAQFAGDAPAGTPAVAMPTLLGEVAHTMGLDWVPDSPAELAQSIQEHIAEQIRVGLEARSTDAVRDANNLLRLDDFELVRTALKMQRDELQVRTPGALTEDDEDIEQRLVSMEAKDQIIDRAKAIRRNIETSREAAVRKHEDESFTATKQQKSDARAAVKANEVARQRVIAVGSVARDMTGNPYGQKTIEAMATYLTTDDYAADFYSNPTAAIRAMAIGPAKEDAIYSYHFLRALAQHPRTANAFAAQQSRFPTAHLDTPLAKQLLAGGSPVASASSVPVGSQSGVEFEDVAEFSF